MQTTVRSRRFAVLTTTTRNRGHVASTGRVPFDPLIGNGHHTIYEGYFIFFESDRTGRNREEQGGIGRAKLSRYQDRAELRSYHTPFYHHSHFLVATK